MPLKNLVAPNKQNQNQILEHNQLIAFKYLAFPGKDFGLLDNQAALFRTVAHHFGVTHQQVDTLHNTLADNRKAYHQLPMNK